MAVFNLCSHKVYKELGWHPCVSSGIHLLCKPSCRSSTAQVSGEVAYGQVCAPDTPKHSPATKSLIEQVYKQELAVSAYTFFPTHECKYGCGTHMRR